MKLRVKFFLNQSSLVSQLLVVILFKQTFWHLACDENLIIVPGGEKGKGGNGWVKGLGCQL